MLTIEQLRAMPEGNRAGYLAIMHNGIANDEHRATRYQCEAEELERRAGDLREYVGRVSKRAREARAYFVTLEAAGLWPLPNVTA